MIRTSIDEFLRRASNGMVQNGKRAVVGLAVPLAIVVSIGSISVCQAAPPSGTDCTAVSDTYEKLKCRHDNVASQIEYMSTTLANPDGMYGKKLTEGQRGQLDGVRLKSTRSKVKSAAADFKKLALNEAKSNKKNCWLVPLTANDDVNPQDGICDFDQGNPNAQCLAVDLTATGQQQACNPKKKNKSKNSGGLECEQICSSEADLTDAEQGEMDAEAVPMDKEYEALDKELQKVNGDLEQLNDNHATLLRSSPAAFTQSGSCTTPPTTPGLDIAAGILRQVSVTARGLAGISGAACDQTAVALGFGGNGSVVCIVFEAAASVLEIAYTTVDEILQTENGALQNATLTCLQQTAGDINTGFANLYAQHADIKANDNNNTAKIMSQIEQLRAELVNLLSTPLGQRAGFPVK